MFSYIENLAENQDYNHFRIFQCESTRDYLNTEFRDKVALDKTKEFGNLLGSWFKVPNQTVCDQIAKYVRITCFSVEESNNDCIATRIGLMVAFVNLKIGEINKIPFGLNESNKLAETVKMHESYLKRPENREQFFAYAIDLSSTQLEGAEYGGHSSVLIQYPINKEGEIEVRYRYFQSYLNHYSLSDNIKAEKEKHLLDGSFSHENCIALLEKIGRLVESSVWNEEADSIHKEIFRVSLPNLLGKKLKSRIPCSFHYKIGNQEKFHRNNKKLVLISEQMKAFHKNIILPKDVYEKKLVAGFNACILEVDFYPNGWM